MRFLIIATIIYLFTQTDKVHSQYMPYGGGMGMYGGGMGMYGGGMGMYGGGMGMYGGGMGMYGGGMGMYGGGMNNMYNRQTQPLSPYLNLLRGGNTAVNYFYGVQPGLASGGLIGPYGMGGMMFGPRLTFFPYIGSLDEPPEELPKGGMRPTGHPIGFNNTMGYYASPFGMNNRYGGGYGGGGYGGGGYGGNRGGFGQQGRSQGQNIRR